MMPQINLIDGLNQDRTPVSAGLWLLLIVLGSLMVVVLAFVQADYVQSQKTELAAAKEKSASLLLQRDNFDQDHPDQRVQRQVQAEIVQIKTNIQTQKTTLALVAPETGVQRKGFFHYLDALSSKSRQGLWLTEIELNPGAHQARLKGQTVDPSLVPLYLDSLKGTAFDALQFGRMSMVQSTDNNAVYHFELDSRTNLAQPVIRRVSQ